MLASVAAAFWGLYVATYTRWYTFDSLAYAMDIRRFEQTGEADWLWHPHHLLFNGAGWLFHCLLRSFNPEAPSLMALQASTAFMGAVGLAAFGAWVYEETGSPSTAVIGMAALGGSFGWWFASTDGRANVAATALLLLVLHALRRAARLASLPWYGTAGALLGLTCLVHQSHFLFLPVALLTAATSPDPWPRRLRPAAIFLVVFLLTVCVPYATVLFGIKGFRSTAAALYWLTTYARQGTWWSFRFPQNLLADLQALYKVFTGQDLTRLADGRIDLGSSWGVATTLIWGLLLAAGLPGAARGAWRRRRAFFFAPLLALGLYSAFFTIWNPGYFVFWFAQAAFLIALLAMAWHEGVRHPFARIALACCTVALVGLTYAGAIAPRTHADHNPHLVLALRVRRIADTKGLVVLSGMGGAAEAEVYIPYFAHVPVLALHSVWARAGGQTPRAAVTIQETIDHVLARGNRVYLLSEVTRDPSSLRAMARRYGVSGAQIRAVFAPYEQVPVDRNGYVVIYRLQSRRAV